MLHHGFGETAEVWNEQVNQLKNQFRLLIPDIPGSGKSDFIEMTNPSLDVYAEGMAKILEEEKISEIIFIGHSMGGYIAMAMAEKYPEKLLGLGLFHSSSFADDEEKKKSRQKGIEFIQTHGATSFLKSTIPNLFADAGTEMKNRLLDGAEDFSDNSVIQYYQAMMNRPDRSEILKNFKKPFLLIMGEKDKAVPFDISLKQTYLAEVSFIEVLRESAHMGMWEEKEKSNRVLTRFLEAF